MCLAISNNLLLVLQDAPKLFFFFYEIAMFWSAKKRRKDFCSTLHPLSTVIFSTATILAFVLLRDSRFSCHCYAQREATPTQKSARKCAATSRRLLARKITKRIHSSKPASLNRPIGLSCCFLVWLLYRPQMSIVWLTYQPQMYMVWFSCRPQLFIV